MSEPFEQRAKYFQQELKAARAVIREQQKAIDIFAKEREVFRARLIDAEKFLVSEGYVRLKDNLGRFYWEKDSAMEQNQKWLREARGVGWDTNPKIVLVEVEKKRWRERLRRLRHK